MPANITVALVYVIDALSSIVLVILLLRFLLPYLGADFRNPIAQAILKITSPLVIPVRRLVPSFGRLDTATILLAFVIQIVSVWITLKIAGGSVPFSYLAFSSVIQLLTLTIQIFLFSVIISIVISWIAPGQYTPIAAIVGTISEPVLRPFRRIIPPIGGFDISPIFAIIALTALSLVVRGMQPFWS